MSHSKLAGLRRDVGIVTYVELIELAGMTAPSSARERNVLNIMAFWDQDAQPARSNLVFDLSQTVGRLQERVDGQLFTVAKNSKPWLMRLGQTMDLKDQMALFGIPENVDFGMQSQDAVQALLGNSMHCADIGTCLVLAVLLKMGVMGCSAAA